MRRRIRDVDTCAEYRGGAAVRVERPNVCNTVDPARHAADDARSGACERGRDFARHALTVSRTPPRSYNRHTRRLQDAEVTNIPERPRRLREIEKRRGIVVVADLERVQRHARLRGAEAGRRGAPSPSSSRAAVPTMRRATYRGRDALPR